MNSKDFKIIFDTAAKANAFKKKFGGWFKESHECTVVLDLQKSKFGDFYELNIKIFIQGLFGSSYVTDKNLVKKHAGDVFTRQPDNYRDVLDFDILINDEERRENLNQLFSEYIVPVTNKALSRIGLKELDEIKTIYLLPAVREELSQLKAL